MRFKFLFLCIILSGLIFPQNQSLNNLITRLKTDDALHGAQWSVYAKYVGGEEIISFNENYNLAPASGLKIFSSAFALYSLGKDFKFQTKLYYDGSINNGVLNGSLYIKGSGDPTLGSTLVKGSLSLDTLMSQWIDAIKTLGIKKVSGKVFADALLFEDNSIPDYWPWIDIGNYYGAAPSALTINDNLYHLYFKPGRVGETAEILRTEPFIPGLSFVNKMKTGKTGSGDNGYIYNAPNSYSAELKGTIPAGVNEFSIKGSIPNPALFAAQHLAAKLELNNIHVSGGSELLHHQKDYDESKLITSIFSPPLEDIVFIVNKKSNNLYTELILKAASLKISGKPGTEEGIESLEKFLNSNGINTKGLDLYDGSGLSRTNTITTKMMVELLSFMTTTNVFDAFYNSLAVAGLPGDEGSFSSYGKGTVIAGNARIKSGLINGVRSHSGYLKDQSGRLIAFSMIANNYPGSTSRINEIHKEIMIALAGLK